MEFLGENIGCDNCPSKGHKWGMRCSSSYFMGIMGVAWQKFTDTQVRRQMVPVICASQDKFKEGETNIERALDKIEKKAK